MARRGTHRRPEAVHRNHLQDRGNCNAIRKDNIDRDGASCCGAVLAEEAKAQAEHAARQQEAARVAAAKAEAQGACLAGGRPGRLAMAEVCWRAYRGSRKRLGMACSP